MRELNRPFNIFKSECFAQSHRVSDATLRSNKGKGLEPAVQHKEPLSAEDRQRLQVYFADVIAAKDPVKLDIRVVRDYSSFRLESTRGAGSAEKYGPQDRVRER